MKKLYISLLLIVGGFLVYCSDDKHETETETETNGTIEVYQTSESSNTYMAKMPNLDFTKDIEGITVRIDTTKLEQPIYGFGASLTGSSAYLLKNMEANKRAELLKNLFTSEGIGIKYLRLPIGSSDFSLDNYTYCDVEGIENFQIPEIDKRDLLPVLKEILTLNPSIQIMGSPWTAPAWMKNNNSLYGGSLKGAEIYPDFAQYFAKYVKFFAAEGITVNAVTLQNEPMHEINTYPTMKMTWQEQSLIIRDYIGPLFAKENIKTNIILWDHNFDGVDYPVNILRDSDTRKYVSGVAFHGYEGKPTDLEPLIKEFPKEPIYFTEQSGGGWNTDAPIGNMLYYMKSMLMPMINLGSRNFLMWNLALNENSGPVTTPNGGCQDCRGVVTIKNDSSYFFNEEYYLLGHFSKFIQEGAHRIEYSLSDTLPTDMNVCAFLNPDGSKVVVMLNQSGNGIDVTVRTNNRRFIYKLLNQSAVTFVYK